METTSSLYSLIQFCPDLSRLEAANVGVLLFCPERGFLRAMTSHGNSRIKKFFGAVDDGWSRIDLLKESFEQRVASEEGRIRTVAELEQFIATRANELQITPPRPVKVKDPSAELRSLFERLVGGEERKDAAEALKLAFFEAVHREGLDAKVWREVPPIALPEFGRTVKVPYAYQNGRLNLIQPVRFTGTSAAVHVNHACRYAVEGDLLFKHEDPSLGRLKLLVVGEFTDGAPSSRDRVAGLLRRYEVGFYDASQLKPLLDDIRRTGHARPAAE